MKHRPILTLLALALTALLLWHALTPRQRSAALPGADAPTRHLLRIWVCSSPGGGDSWLRASLKSWEKQHPSVMTFLRTVSPKELASPDAVLPDLLLYTPGDITTPQTYFLPITGISGLREEFLRAGRCQGEQYALPLCYAAYALAIDAASEPHLAVTPAPTTLLGRPAATVSPDATPTPGLPDDATLLAPKGCGLFALRGLLTTEPSLADGFATLAPADVFARFKSHHATAALLTTGQIAALNSAMPVRVLTPSEVITDQVWLASIFPKADPTAAQLLRYLVSGEAQRTLTQQSLHTVREDLRLYATGTEAAIESAAADDLTVINAYIPAADTEAAAWQFWNGQQTLDSALLPLL